MVTAELAIALPTLVLALSLLLAVVGAASDASRTAEAARSAARAASIGTPNDVVVAQAKQQAPVGSAIRVWTDGPWVRVEIIAPGRRWGPVPFPAPDVTGAALLEPGITP